MTGSKSHPTMEQSQKHGVSVLVIFKWTITSITVKEVNIKRGEESRNHISVF